MTQAEFQERYLYDPNSDCLGRGGFGAVYRAHDTLRGREVAIKVSEVRDERFRLKHEVDIAKSLPEHRNIAHYEECHTISTLSGTYDFAIMQYYKAGSLEHLLTHKPLTIEQRYDILRQLLEGISFLHSHNIIHRDLKPQNILIDKYHGKITLKITDFGISKHLDDNANSVVTNSLMGVGTLSYASPEQLSSKNIRHNTDLWSFGVLAFRVLTNTLPFTSGQYIADSEDGRNEIIRQIKTGVLPSAIYSISEPWRDIIKRCLTTDNTLRIQTAKECISLLDGNIYREELPNHEEETIKSIEPVIETPIVEKEVVKVKPRRRKKETTPVIPYIKTRYDKIFDWIYICASWLYTIITTAWIIDLFIAYDNWYIWPILSIIINILISIGITLLRDESRHFFVFGYAIVFLVISLILSLILTIFFDYTPELLIASSCWAGLICIIPQLYWLKYIIKWGTIDNDEIKLSRFAKIITAIPIIYAIYATIDTIISTNDSYINAITLVYFSTSISFSLIIIYLFAEKDAKLLALIMYIFLSTIYIFLNVITENQYTFPPFIGAILGWIVIFIVNIVSKNPDHKLTNLYKLIDK